MDKQPIILENRPIIGISACCMGCPVRYNGRSFDMLKFLGREKGDFTWVPVCPECEAGLGVIRPPVHIAGEHGAAVWQGEATVRSRGGQDVTQQVMEGARAAEDVLRRAGAQAFIYLDGSPTCGVYRTTLRDQKRGKPPGVFGAILQERGWFLIPALDLQSPLKWWDWRRRLLAFIWLQDVPLQSKDDLFTVWYRLKFMCQELDDTWARTLGRELAALGQKPDPEIYETFRRQVSDQLRKPSTPARLKGSLLKQYANFRKKTGQTVPEIQAADVRRNVTTIARELTLMERASAATGHMIGTAPVLYSGKLPKPSRQKAERLLGEAIPEASEAAD